MVISLNQLDHCMIGSDRMDQNGQKSHAVMAWIFLSVSHFIHIFFLRTSFGHSQHRYKLRINP